jgi:hypothetical protein
VFGKNHAHRFAADLVDDSAFDRVLGHQSHRPARSTRRWWTADQCDQRCLLAAIQLRLVHPIQARLFAQCVIEATFRVAARDTRNLAPVRAQRLRRRAQRLALVQHQQGLHATPDSRRPLLARPAPSPQLAPIGLRQFQSLKALRSLHPPL